jgi:hypothetical protein
MAKRILLALSMVFAAACAHDHALTRADMAAMRNDSPAISPWSGPVPNETSEEARSNASRTALDDEWQ